jgi:hypothetical protein
MDPPQTGHFTFLPDWSFRATRTCPQVQTSWWEPAGMRISPPWAAIRVRTFSRVLGSNAQTTLNFAAQEGQACSRPTEAAGTGTETPQAQRTAPRLFPESPASGVIGGF